DPPQSVAPDPGARAHTHCPRRLLLGRAAGTTCARRDRPRAGRTTMTRYQRASDVGIVTGEDGVLYVAALPDGPILVLAGTAADVWRAAPGTDPAELATRLPERPSATGADHPDRVAA